MLRWCRTAKHFDPRAFRHVFELLYPPSPQVRRNDAQDLQYNMSINLIIWCRLHQSSFLFRSSENIRQSCITMALRRQRFIFVLLNSTSLLRTKSASILWFLWVCKKKGLKRCVRTRTLRYQRWENMITMNCKWSSMSRSLSYLFIGCITVTIHVVCGKSKQVKRLHQYGSGTIARVSCIFLTSSHDLVWGSIPQEHKGSQRDHENCGSGRWWGLVTVPKPSLACSAIDKEPLRSLGNSSTVRSRHCVFALQTC